MTRTIKGSCLCGKVKFEVLEPFHDFYYCHCTRCQKASGSAHATNLFSQSGSVEWLSGEDKIKYFELSKNNNFNKSFCIECGSPVPRRAKSGDFMIIPAGSLDGSPSVRPTKNIFWKDRVSWYESGCQTKKYEGYSE